VQIENEEIVSQLNTLAKRPSQAKAVQVCVDILNSRVMKGTFAFK